MPADIQRRTLLIVSDTAMIYEGDTVLVFDPVLREIKVVAPMFDHIIWLGARTLNKKPSLKPVNNDKVQTVMLPCVSRSGLINVLYVLAAYPVMLYKILKYLPQATHVHSRGPAHPALLAVLLSLFDSKRIYSHKYAGEWTENNIPFTYRLQRAILRRVKRKNVRITISGRNTTNSMNVYDLKNPCIYEEELGGMNELGRGKDFSGELNLLFVGNMMPSKGIIQLMDALDSENLSRRFQNITIVGGGRLLEEVKDKAKRNKRVQIEIAGTLSREELNDKYAKAHILILPSSSESFPKVIAEAAAYGCIPVTTSLSAISKQISDGDNGFLMDRVSTDNIITILNRVSATDSLKQVSLNAIEMSTQFTYERFRESMAKVYDIQQ